MRPFPLLFLIGIFSLLTLQNYSAQWRQTPGPTGGQILAIATDGTNLYAGTEKGTFRSTDNGTSWKFVSKEKSISETISLSIIGDYLFAGTSNGLFRTENKGEGWLAIYYGLPANSMVTSIVSDDGFLFAGTSKGVFISKDSYNWQAVNNGLLTTGINDIAVKGTDIFAATYRGISHTGNFGASWDTLNNGLTETYIHSVLINGNDIYSNLYAGLFISTNNGASWNKITNDLPQTWCHALAAIDSNVFASFHGGDSVYKSTNRGLSWKALTNIGGFSSSAVYGKNLFAGTYAAVYLSTNAGESWQKFSTEPGIGPLAINDQYIFAGSDNSGIYVRKLTEMITSVNENAPLPERFSLRQNYPNPFNPVTTISYSIPKSSAVELKVYDILGREAALLVSKEQNAGEYNIQFDGSSLPSGIYIYTIRAGQYRDSKKMTLLK